MSRSVARVVVNVTASVAMIGCLGALGALPAHAGGPAVPVFAGVAARGAVAPALSASVAAELKRLYAARGARVIVVAAAQGDPVGLARALNAMDAHLDDAARAMAADDRSGAREALLAALSVFEEELAFSDDDVAWARYRELLSMQSTLHVRNRDKAAASAALLQLLAVEPEWKPKRGALDDATLTLLDFARDEARATPPAPLEVKSRPAGARVIVDGRKAGRTPVAVDTAPGVHYVLVDDNSRIHRERVVVGEAGARVSARLGSPEMEAAAGLLRQLRGPATTKREFLELADAVADVTITAVVLPWGKSVQVLAARIVDNQLDAVVGVHVPPGEGAREQALFNVVDASLEKKEDAWVPAGTSLGGADTTPPSTLREAFLAGQGAHDGGAAAVAVGDDQGFPTAAVIGVVVGGVVLAGGVALGVVAWLAGEAEKDTGFRYAVDGSTLE